VSAPARGARPHKEAFFVQVKSADDKLVFFDETARLGKPMPYERPEATCALRVTDKVVAFTLLKMSNRARLAAAGTKLEIPRGPLAKLERRVASQAEPVTADRLLAEIGDTTYTLGLARDENGVITLSMLDGADDISFELPKPGLQLGLYLSSPKNGRTVAANFIGHVGKPGATETVVRVAAMALNHLSSLPVFRMAAGVETVSVPSAPSRYQVARPARKAADSAAFSVPVRMWNDDATPVMLGASTVKVAIDLDTANPVSGRLLFHFTPAADIAEGFESYRQMMEHAVSSTMTAVLGADDIADLVFSIALGELTDGDLGRLRDAAAAVTGLDLSPRQFAVFNPTV
jgi:hypothetical protein